MYSPKAEEANSFLRTEASFAFWDIEGHQMSNTSMMPQKLIRAIRGFSEKLRSVSWSQTLENVLLLLTILREAHNLLQAFRLIG